MLHRAIRVGSGALAVAAGLALASGEGCGASSHPRGLVPDGSSPDVAAGEASTSDAQSDAPGDDAADGSTTLSDGSRADAWMSDAVADSPAMELDGMPAADGGDDAPSAADAPEEADAADDGSSVVITDAGCRIEIDDPPLLPATHVPIGSTVQWDSNPPSSGPHYPIWAAYQAYSTPVPRGYYVHDLEHGAIVLLYNCGDAGCPDVVATLQAASDAIPDDPLCTSLAEGVRVRTVITPDPLLDVPVAAAAWGWVYKAQCADLATLRDFALQHYGQGPEMLCNNGQAQF
jgi:hypothetical protein